MIDVEAYKERKRDARRMMIVHKDTKGMIGGNYHYWETAWKEANDAINSVNMTKEIKEYNEMIAKFMGGKFTLIHSHTPNVEFKRHPNMCKNSNNVSMHPKFLSYHKSGIAVRWRLESTKVSLKNKNI